MTEKSTFSAPASPTSGLQGYDLEGSDRKTKHGKATKSEAGYVDESPTRQCQTCTMFMAPDACTAVRGRISPAGHCNYYNFSGAKKAAKRTLYVKRAVRNGDDLVAWAKANGFPTTLVPDDMHVTIVYSKTAVDWDAVPRSDLPLLRITGGERSLKRLGPNNDAVVLKIESDDLARRNGELLAAGASSDWPAFQAHITLTYDLIGTVNTDKVKPYSGTIELGPEQWAEVNENWKAGIVEKSAPRAAGIALIHKTTGETLFLKRSEDGDDHPGEWNFPGGGITGGESEEAAAIRELYEETGHRLTDDAGRVAVGKVTNPDIEYTTFAQKVDDKFEPRLNREHSAYRWASLDNPPEPMHPWVRAALPLVKSAAIDLTLKAAGAANEDNTMDTLSLFVPVLKVDAKQHIVYGTAVAEVADRANEIFDYKSSKPEFEKWSSDIEKSTDGKSKGNVRSMHGKVAAGKLTDIGFDDERKAIDVAAKIVDEDEWKKVEEGVYTGFSIGGKYLKRWQDGDLKRYTAAPSEISLVDLPCVPTATFSLIKADGTEEIRKFTSVEAGEGEAGKNTPVIEKTEASEADLADEAQVWVHKRLPGKMFAKKADLRQALLELDADEAATKKAAEIIAEIEKGGSQTEKTAEEIETEKAAQAEAAKLAEDEAAKAAAAEAEKRAFSEKERAKDAESGAAESDGSYPIENKTDLENAIRAYGHSKNKAKTKRHIIARARSLGLSAMLPADWKAKKVAAGDLEKDASLYGMSDLMNMLACVECLEDRAEANSYGFGVTLPKEVTDRFGLALVNLGDVVADILDAVLADIREEERDEAVNRAAKIADLLKAGAGIVAEKEESVNKNGEVEKTTASEAVAEENADLKVKLAATEAAFKKILAEELAKRDAKTAELEAGLVKEQARNNDLQKQVMVIRSQPIHAPAGQFYRVVEKSIDDPAAGAVEKAEANTDAESLRKAGLDAQMARIAKRR